MQFVHTISFRVLFGYAGYGASQGRGARTHLMSPAMVAAAAVAGHLADVRDYQLETL